MEITFKNTGHSNICIRHKDNAFFLDCGKQLTTQIDNDDLVYLCPKEIEFEEKPEDKKYISLAKRAGRKASSKLILLTECAWQFSNMADGAIIEIKEDVFLSEEKIMLLPFSYMYVKPTGGTCTYTLIACKGVNKDIVLRNFKILSFVSHLGIGFLFALLALPFRLIKLKRLCKEKTIYAQLSNYSGLGMKEVVKSVTQDVDFVSVYSSYRKTKKKIKKKR